jgi:WD40 repeat protein
VNTSIREIQLRAKLLKKGRLGKATALTWSPDGKTVLASVWQQKAHGLHEVHWIEAATNSLQRREVLPERFESAERASAVSPDGRRVAVVTLSRPLVEIWDVKTRKRLHRLTATATSLAFSPDGKLLVGANSDNNSLRLWDARAFRLKRKQGFKEEIGTIRFSADGKTLLSSFGFVHDIATGKTRQFPQELDTTENSQFTGLPYANCINDDGRFIATAHEVNLVHSGGLKLWDSSQSSLIRVLEKYKKRLTALAFSRDTSILASADEDGTIKLWDVATGRLLHVRPGNVMTGPFTINLLLFSPDGTKLAIGGYYYGRPAQVWKLG